MDDCGDILSKQYGRKAMHRMKKKKGRIWIGALPLLCFTAAAIYVMDSVGVTKHTMMDAAVQAIQSNLGYKTAKSCMPVFTYDASQSGEKTIYEYLEAGVGELLPIYGYARKKDTQLAMGEYQFFDEGWEDSCSGNLASLASELALKESEQAAQEEDKIKGAANAALEEKAADTIAKTEKQKYPREKLNDFDFLLQNFYRVDSTTTTNGKQLNAAEMLAKDMSIDKNKDGPQILIYHTHSQEGYADSKDKSQTVVGLGDYLTKLLEEKYGYSVLHHKGEYDIPDRDTAYSRSAPALEKIVRENPSLQVILDLHRDGVEEGTRLVHEVNGRQTATIMFFNGLSHTTAQGDIGYLANPNLADNLAFSFQLQLAAAENYPGFSRCIYLRGYRYNLHYLPKSALVEVGAQTNTYQEALNAMEPLADVMDRVLSGKVK